MRSLLALAVILVIAATSEARDRRIRQTYQQQTYSHTTPTSSMSATTIKATSSVGDGLAEVNALRAARGLRPFVRDEALTQGAIACATFRAERHLFGHSANDFGFLRGVMARAAGCAAYPASYGWMSCAVYDSATYAGAAWVTGSDGKRYMHLFIR